MKKWLLIFWVAAAAYARPINDGNRLFADGDFQGALEKYEEARQSEPSNPILFYNMGTCLYKLGDYEKAQKE